MSMADWFIHLRQETPLVLAIRNSAAACITGITLMVYSVKAWQQLCLMPIHQSSVTMIMAAGMYCTRKVLTHPGFTTSVIGMKNHSARLPDNIRNSLTLKFHTTSASAIKPATVTIEGYLTVPEGSKDKPLPTIIFPHGGPGVRDYAGFDYWTAALVNESYAVLRPNFRGSSGYGYDFANAANKGWGLEMQDDITDGTKWLIENGVADPDRVCIVGASYGGYATAMALVKEPDLYRCGVSFAGVMDLKRLVQHYRNFVNSRLVKNQIGDDCDDLKERSPYYRVEEIKAPLLLVHGEDDRVVDVVQSPEMFDEMKDEDKQVEYIELVNSTHYLTIQRNRSALFDAMTKFLRDHLQSEKKPAN